MSTNDSPLDIARRLMEAHGKTTPGEWTAETSSYGEEHWLGGESRHVVPGSPRGGQSVIVGPEAVMGDDGNTQSVLDAAFIAAAHEAVPILVAEVERLTARVAAIESAATDLAAEFEKLDHKMLDRDEWYGVDDIRESCKALWTELSRPLDDYGDDR